MPVIAFSFQVSIKAKRNENVRACVFVIGLGWPNTVTRPIGLSFFALFKWTCDDIVTNMQTKRQNLKRIWKKDLKKVIVTLFLSLLVSGRECLTVGTWEMGVRSACGLSLGLFKRSVNIMNENIEVDSWQLVFHPAVHSLTWTPLLSCFSYRLVDCKLPVLFCLHIYLIVLHFRCKMLLPMACMLCGCSSAFTLRPCRLCQCQWFGSGLNSRPRYGIHIPFTSRRSGWSTNAVSSTTRFWHEFDWS